MKRLLLSVLILVWLGTDAQSDYNLIPTGDRYTIRLGPVPGDSYDELQWGINTCISDPRYHLELTEGEFLLSRPLLIARQVGADYGQVHITIQGACRARDAPNGYSDLVPLFNSGFVIGIQQGKSCVLRNLAIDGWVPNHFTPLQIDTLPQSAWTTDNRTSPYAGIVIDPFSDPVNYDSVRYRQYAGMSSLYLPGMSRSGSTDIIIDGCRIQGFTVGIMVTPSYQQNGELIDVRDCSISACESAYAWSQAQGKVNTVTNLMCWGNVRTVFNGIAYGFQRSDGATAPMVDLVNIAGAVNQLCYMSAYTFPATFRGVYAEGLFKLGFAQGNAGTHFDDFQIDFQVGADGMPSPDCYFYGDHTFFSNCMLRVYGKSLRLPLTGHNWFMGTVMSAAPILVTAQQAYNRNSIPDPVPDMSVTSTYPAGLEVYHRIDSAYVLSPDSSVQVYIDRSTFTGYMLADNPAIEIGDHIMTVNQLQNINVTSYQYPLGDVTSMSRDTVYLSNMGEAIHNGRYWIWKAQTL